MDDKPHGRTGVLRGDEVLREGMAVGPRPALTFDRDRWEAGAAARAGAPLGRSVNWMVGAAVAATAAMTAPAWLHSAHVIGPVPPHVVESRLGEMRAPIGLEHLWMASAMRGWALGGPGAILITADGGRRWQNVLPPQAPAVGAFAVRSSRDAWWAAANRAGVRIYHTQNAGRSWAWTELAGPPFPAGWRLSRHALALGPRGTAYLLVAPNWYGKAGSPPAGPDTLWATHDSGATWTPRVLSGFPGGVEDAGRLYTGAGGVLFLESAGHHHVWWSSDGGQHWTPVAIRGVPAGARLVGEPVFFGRGRHAPGLWLASKGGPGLPLGQDTTDVLASSTGGASWMAAMTVQGFSPVLAAASPNQWTGAAADPMTRGTSGPPGQYFGASHARAGVGQWVRTLVPRLSSAAHIGELDFLNRQDQWVLVDVGGTSELWASTDGGREWSELSSGVNLQAP